MYPRSSEKKLSFFLIFLLTFYLQTVLLIGVKLKEVAKGLDRRSTKSMVTVLPTIAASDKNLSQSNGKSKPYDEKIFLPVCVKHLLAMFLSTKRHRCQSGDGGAIEISKSARSNVCDYSIKEPSPDCS